MTTPTTHPFSISAPFTMTVKPNTESGTFKVTNTGSQAISVHESVARLSEHSIMYPAADHATTTHMGAPWLTVSPHDFTIAPGQAETVHIAAHVPAGVQGNHYLEVVWTAKPAHAVSGPLHLAGAVATTTIIPMPGIAQPVTSQGVPRAPLAPHHGLSTVDLAGAGLAAALVASVAGLVIRRARRSRRNRRAEVTA